ncbi:hypothetical protein H0H93_008259, partial [Arthromyces matolae]
LLDAPGLDWAFKKKLIAITQQISEASGCYPACYVLQGVEVGRFPHSGGSFADIYVGLFQGKAVCVKSIRIFEQEQISYLLKQISKEALLWCQLSHPNILSMFGLFRFALKVCLVSSWMENGNVVTYLESNPDVVRILLVFDIANGIEYLHDIGVIHGNLKGTNVLVDGAHRARLADFGMAYLDLDADVMDGCRSEPDVIGKIPHHEMKRLHEVLILVTTGKRLQRPPLSEPPWTTWGLTEDIWSIMNDCWKQSKQRPDSSDVVRRLAKLKPEDTRPPAVGDDLVPSDFRRSMSGLSDMIDVQALEDVLSSPRQPLSGEQIHASRRVTVTDRERDDIIIRTPLAYYHQSPWPTTDPLKIARGTRVAELAESYKKFGSRFTAIEIKDLTSDQFPEALKGVDAVIHAAAPLPGKEDTASMLHSAVEGTLNVVRQAEKAGIKRIVVTSSMVTVLNPGGGITDKDWHPTSKEEALKTTGWETYSAAKTLAEKELWAFADAHPH